MSKTKEDLTFLDKNLIQNFMELIKSDDMFIARDDLKKKYNLICTFKDRLYTAVDYLNEHDEVPKKETDFINYMVYACMIYDGVKMLYENIFNTIPKYINSKKYFKNAKHYKQYFFDESNTPYDYVFFEYLRAMVFAHPYGVDKKRCKDRLFMQDGEIHYCPWVLIPNTLDIDELKDGVGIRIYSSIKEDDIIDLTISFRSLKGFIKNVYSRISDFIQWAKDEIEKQNNEWLKTKVNRNQDSISIMKEIKAIMESRYKDTYTIERAISYLTCDLSDKTNQANVEKFRNAIKDRISAVCDYIDSLDYEEMEKQLSLLYDRPDEMHQMAHYQLEKIYTYLEEKSEILNPYSDEYWGLKQADDFYRQFAKKWVNIDVATMEYDEIKLLVATACFLEKQEQDSKKEKNK